MQVAFEAWNRGGMTAKAQEKRSSGAEAHVYSKPGATPFGLVLLKIRVGQDRCGRNCGETIACNGEYIGGLPRKRNGNSGLWKVGREE
jgi:hypothetical protein